MQLNQLPRGEAATTKHEPKNAFHYNAYNKSLVSLAKFLVFKSSRFPRLVLQWTWFGHYAKGCWPLPFPYSTELPTSIFVDGIRLACVLCHLVVDEINHIRSDGSAEYSWQTHTHSRGCSIHMDPHQGSGTCCCLLRSKVMWLNLGTHTITDYLSKQSACLLSVISK